MTSESNENSSDKKTYIVYDGDCPFCSQYVKMVKLQKSVGPVELVNARSEHPAVTKVTNLGLSLDEGMALVQGDSVSYGAECINKIALLTTDLGWFNKLNALVFRSPHISAILYPILRAFRNFTLLLMGRSKIKK